MSTISINTTQNVTIDYELAGLMERILAFFIDTIILVVYVLLLLGFASLINFGDDSTGFLLVFITLIFPAIIAYHLLCESFWNGQSIGKKALGIRVVKCNGEQMDMSDFGKRWMFRLIDILLSMGSVAVISVLSTDYGQRLGDLVGDTCVIKTKPKTQLSVKDLAAIKSKKNHEPKYLGVTQFTEEDMLLLKNILDRAKSTPNEHYQKLLKELTAKICKGLDIPVPKTKRTAFLRTILNDYIVLTR